MRGISTPKLIHRSTISDDRRPTNVQTLCKKGQGVPRALGASRRALLNVFGTFFGCLFDPCPRVHIRRTPPDHLSSIFQLDGIHSRTCVCYDGVSEPVFLWSTLVAGTSPTPQNDTSPDFRNNALGWAPHVRPARRRSQRSPDEAPSQKRPPFHRRRPARICASCSRKALISIGVFRTTRFSV